MAFAICFLMSGGLKWLIIVICKDFKNYMEDIKGNNWHFPVSLRCKGIYGFKKKKRADESGKIGIDILVLLSIKPLQAFYA